MVTNQYRLIQIILAVANIHSINDKNTLKCYLEARLLLTRQSPESGTYAEEENMPESCSPPSCVVPSPGTGLIPLASYSILLITSWINTPGTELGETVTVSSPWIRNTSVYPPQTCSDGWEKIIQGWHCMEGERLWDTKCRGNDGRGWTEPFSAKSSCSVLWLNW